MRILFVTPYIPSLIRVRPLNFLRQLSKRHEVTLISLGQGDKSEAVAVEELRSFCEAVHVLPMSKAGSLMSCCRRLLTSMPLQAAFTDLQRYRDFIEQVAGAGAFDVLHVEHIRGAHLVRGIDRLPKVYDSVDCITRLLKQRLGRERGVFQRILGYEELLKMRSYEARVAAGFDRVIITSDRDRRALEHLIRRFESQSSGRKSAETSIAEGLRLPPPMSLEDFALPITDYAAIDVIRNGVDTNYFHPVDTRTEAASIVFSGKMSYFANVSAVLDFYEKVFPWVRKTVPDARFKIVGSDPPDAVLKLAKDPAVEVTGYVPDIRPHLASATAVVCPLSIGVGIQNKVLEAMAMARPVVASPIAFRGIPGAVDGHHMVMGKDSSRMAEAVISLLNHPEYGRRLGEHARRLVEEEYSWDAAAKALEEIYAQAAGISRRAIDLVA